MQKKKSSESIIPFDTDTSRVQTESAILENDSQRI